MLLLGDMNVRLRSRRQVKEDVEGCHMLQHRDWKAGGRG